MADATGFDLSAIANAVKADSNALAAFETLHCTMLDWYGSGTFPELEEVQKVLTDSYAKCRKVSITEGTIKQYAYGILKWAKAGQVPVVSTMASFMKSVPGEKSTRGRKAKGAQTAPEGEAEAPKTPEGLTPLAQARAWINSIQATRMAFLGTADAEVLSEALLQALAVLNRVKG